MGCKKYCKNFKVKKPPGIGRYASGQVSCQVCDVWLDHTGCHLKNGYPAKKDSLGMICNCCNYRVRTKPRKTIYKEKLRGLDPKGDAYVKERRAFFTGHQPIENKLEELRAQLDSIKKEKLDKQLNAISQSRYFKNFMKLAKPQQKLVASEYKKHEHPTKLPKGVTGLLTEADKLSMEKRTKRKKEKRKTKRKKRSHVNKQSSTVVTNPRHRSKAERLSREAKSASRWNQEDPQLYLENAVLNFIFERGTVTTKEISDIFSKKADLLSLKSKGKIIWNEDLFVWELSKSEKENRP